MLSDSKSDKREEMKRIAVLMTCYNRVDTTLECLRRLFVQEVPDGYSFDVWLVDDNSPDKTGEKVKSAYPQVNVVQGTGSLFWCKGMRLAWDKAAGAYDYDFYLWLNDDTMLTEGAIKCLIADYENVAKAEDEAHTIVGSFTTAPDSDFISYGTVTKSGERLIPNGAPQRVSGVMAGNCVLISRAVYGRIGPICGKFHHGGGDYDYAYLMHESGIPFYCASKVIGWCPANHSNFTFKGKNLWQRIRLLWRPKGVCLHDALLMRMRHGGIFRATLTFFHVVWITVRGK